MQWVIKGHVEDDFASRREHSIHFLPAIHRLGQMFEHIRQENRVERVVRVGNGSSQIAHLIQVIVAMQTVAPVDALDFGRELAVGFVKRTLPPPMSRSLPATWIGINRPYASAMRSAINVEPALSSALFVVARSRPFRTTNLVGCHSEAFRIRQR